MLMERNIIAYNTEWYLGLKLYCIYHNVADFISNHDDTSTIKYMRMMSYR